MKNTFKVTTSSQTSSIGFSTASNNITVNTEQDNLIPVETSSPSVITDFGNTARDNVLKFELENEVCSKLTVAQTGNTIKLTILSKTDNVLGEGEFELLAGTEITNIRLDSYQKRLVIEKSTGPDMYCDLSALYEDIEAAKLTSANAGNNIEIVTDSSGNIKINARVLDQEITSFTATKVNDNTVSLSILQKNEVKSGGLSLISSTVQKTASLSVLTINGQSMLGTGDIRLVTEDIINNSSYKELSVLNDPKTVYIYANELKTDSNGETLEKGRVTLETAVGGTASALGYSKIKTTELDRTTGEVKNIWTGGEIDFVGIKKNSDSD